MRESIVLIKWGSILSTVFLIITYIVSINAETGFLILESVWISNNFVLTLFGGAFTSMLVVMLCEIRKYLSVKSQSEQYLFDHGLYLYEFLLQLHQNIEAFLNHDEWPISENLFDDNLWRIRCEINALRATDYYTFKQTEDTLMNVQNRFRMETYLEIQFVLQFSERLKHAFYENEIENLQNAIKDITLPSPFKLITSANPRVCGALQEGLSVSSSGIKIVNDYLESIDSHCNMRFQWMKKRDMISIPPIENCMEKS